MKKHSIRFMVELMDINNPHLWVCSCGFESRTYEEQMIHQMKEKKDTSSKEILVNGVRYVCKR